MDMSSKLNWLRLSYKSDLMCEKNGPSIIVEYIMNSASIRDQTLISFVVFMLTCPCNLIKFLWIGCMYECLLLTRGWDSKALTLLVITQNNY